MQTTLHSAPPTPYTGRADRHGVVDLVTLLQAEHDEIRQLFSQYADAMTCALANPMGAQRTQALAHARAHDWHRVLGQMVQRCQGLVQQGAHPRQAVVPRQAAARGSDPASAGLDAPR